MRSPLKGFERCFMALCPLEAFARREMYNKRSSLSSRSREGLDSGEDVWETAEIRHDRRVRYIALQTHPRPLRGPRIPSRRAQR